MFCLHHTRTFAGGACDPTKFDVIWLVFYFLPCLLGDFEFKVAGIWGTLRADLGSRSLPAPCTLISFISSFLVWILPFEFEVNFKLLPPTLGWTVLTMGSWFCYLLTAAVASTDLVWSFYYCSFCKNGWWLLVETITLDWHATPLCHYRKEVWSTPCNS